MRRYLSVPLMVAAVMAGNTAVTVTVVDSTDRAALPGTSVIAASGVIVGVTDADGRITVGENDFPLSLRSVGYEAVTSGRPDGDTVMMQPAKYTLAEMNVDRASRPITRVLTYAREYCTGATPTDTMQLYSEYMLEYFFADGKVKGYSKSHASSAPRARRSFGRIYTAGRDSVMRPRSGDDISSLSFLQSMAFVPYDAREVTQAMKDGADTDTVDGKFYPKYVYRLGGQTMTIDWDALADHKEHVWSPWFFKLLGMTMDMGDAKCSLIYNRTDTGVYELRDFVYGVYNLRVTGRGKLLRKLLGVKDEIDIRCYMEQYPVEIQRLTAEEYREMKKDYYERREEFVLPANVQPLPPAVQRLVERAKAE